MSCVIERERPRKSEPIYFESLFQHSKGFRKRAKEYVVKSLPGIVHGKLLRSNSSYLVPGNKRLVLIGAPQTTDIASEFQTLVNQWKTDTLGVSSLSDMFMHPAYQRIMAIGKPALPFILRDLQQNSGHWFHALSYIAGKDVAAGTNSVADATAAWLEWGYTNGHI